MKRLRVITTLCVLLTSAVGAGQVSVSSAHRPLEREERHGQKHNAKPEEDDDVRVDRRNARP